VRVGENLRDAIINFEEVLKSMGLGELSQLTQAVFNVTVIMQLV
jgi:hypothetical protein